MPTRLSKAQLGLLRVAKAQLALDEDSYREILERFGGSRSAADLDAGGFTAVMARFQQLGFVSTSRKRGFGERVGMASAAQLEMIQGLFAEASGDNDAGHLTAWLEKYHKVSSLRFVTMAKAGQIIAALKAWRERGQGGDHGKAAQL